MNAWIVTWEYLGELTDVNEQFVALFSSRKSSRLVKEFVEDHYLRATASAKELAFYANRRGQLPYKGETTHFINEVPHGERVTCGHNPWLYARRVTNLRVQEPGEGVEIITWTEPPEYRWHDPEQKTVKLSKAGKEKSVTRDGLLSVGKDLNSLDL